MLSPNFGVFFTQVIESRDLMITSQESSAVSKSPGQYKFIWIIQLQGLCEVMVKSSTQRILDRRKQYRMAICGQGMQRKDGPDNGVSEMAKSWS